MKYRNINYSYIAGSTSEQTSGRAKLRLPGSPSHSCTLDKLSGFGQYMCKFSQCLLICTFLLKYIPLLWGLIVKIHKKASHTSGT